METKGNTPMLGNHDFMSNLPKHWTRISNRIRGTPKQDTMLTLDELKGILESNMEALHILSWDHGPEGDFFQDESNQQGGGVGRGYGNGGGNYVQYAGGGQGPEGGDDGGGQGPEGGDDGGGQGPEGGDDRGGLGPRSREVSRRVGGYYGGKNNYSGGGRNSYPGGGRGKYRGHDHVGLNVREPIEADSMATLCFEASGLAEEALCEVSHGNSSVAQDVKPSVETSNSVHSLAIRKRSEVQDVTDSNKDDGVPGKRVKTILNLSEDSKGNVVGNSSSQKVNADNGQVQQLVSMFSSLVAQGEQSAGMLEILISSISATTHGNENLVNTGSHPATTQADNLSSYLTDIISRSTNSQLTDSALETQTDEAETLRDSFPPNDKSLTRLLSEVPYLQKPVLKLLESLCVPGNSENEAELHSGGSASRSHHCLELNSA